METTQEAVLVTGGRRASAWRWFGAAGCRTPVLAADLSQERLDVMGDIAPPESWGACAWMCRTKRRSWMRWRGRRALSGR